MEHEEGREQTRWGREGLRGISLAPSSVSGAGAGRGAGAAHHLPAGKWAAKPSETNLQDWTKPTVMSQSDQEWPQIDESVISATD